MFELDSIYIKLSPIGGRLVALESPVGLSVFVDFIKLCIFPLLFLLLQFIYHCCNNFPPVFGTLLIMMSITCCLFFFLRLNTIPLTVTFK